MTLISTDSHVIEPPDLWVERIDRAYADRAPRLVPEDDGDWWYADGFRLQSVTGGTDAGVRFQDQTKLRMAARMDEVRKGAYEPDAKLADMDLDGVDREVVYTTIGLRLWRVPDGAYVRATFRAYNEWIAEFCNTAPSRLAGIALILTDDVDDAVTDLRAAAALGLKGAQITVYPGDERPYDHPGYEPLWAAAAELHMPLSLHIGSNRLVGAPVQDTKFLVKPSQYSTASHWVQVSIADMIFSGVFERFPHLMIVSLEHEAAWAPFFLNVMDYTYTQRARRSAWHRFKGDTLPSHFFHSNVFVSFQEDPLALPMRHSIGVGNLVWGSDYPHHETTFPHSRDVLDQVFAGVADDERRTVLEETPARLYRF